jgi:hypothetical protein
LYFVIFVVKNSSNGVLREIVCEASRWKG